MATTVSVTRSTLFAGGGDVDGDGQADPGDTLITTVRIQNLTAFDALNLTLSDTLLGSTLVAGSVKITPIAFDDSYTGITGNTPITYGAGQGVLSNDVDPDGAGGNLGLTVTKINGVSIGGNIAVTGGTVNMLSSGGFTFTPTTGFIGDANFTYTIQDAQNLNNVTTGLVTLHVNGGQIWYVDNTASAAGADGSYLHPFLTLGALNDNGTGAAGTVGPNDSIIGDDDVDGAGQTIFVYHNGAAYTAGITLEAGQNLIGDGQALLVNGHNIGGTERTGGIDDVSTNAVISQATGTVITLSTDNVVKGVTLDAAGANAIGMADGNGSVTTAAGTLTVSGVAFTGVGQAIDIDQGGNLNVSITSLTSTGSSGQGVQIAGTAASGTGLISGTVNIAGGNIQGAASHDFLIGGAGPSSGGTVAVTYGGTLGSSTGGSAVNINDRIAGAGGISFTGNIAQTSTASNTSAGISLSNIAAGTIDLTGTKTIAVTSGAQNAIQISSHSGGNINLSGGAIDIDFSAGTTGSAFSIGSQAGGTVTVSTAVDIDFAGTASGAGINMTSASAAPSGSVNFTGGNLTITTQSGDGINFTNTNQGSVQLNISNGGNTVNTTTGQILDIFNGTIGAAGMNFTTLHSGTVAAGSAISISNLDSAAGGAFSGGNVDVDGTTGATADGINITNSSAAFSFNSATIDNTGGDGIEINGLTQTQGAVTFNTVDIDNTTGNGVSIISATNAVTISGGSIGTGGATPPANDPTGDAVNVTGGTGAVTIAADIAKTTAGNVVDISNHNTGTINVTGTISSTGTSNGIALSNNTGGTINFTHSGIVLNTGANNAFAMTNTAGTGATVNLSGGTLAITTAAGTGLTATSTTAGAGTINITGSGNTLVSTAGTGVNIVNTNIGSSDITFQSVNVGGAAFTAGNGITLDTTGALGGFHITGTGSAGSGGTIQHKSGADLNNLSGVGIYLNNTYDVQLNQMQLNDFQNFAIRGNNVTNFTLADSVINGISGSVTSGADEAAIRFDGLLGRASITNSNLQGGWEYIVKVLNTTGTLDRFTVSNTTIGNNHDSAAGNGGDAFQVIASGNSTVNVSLTNDTFLGAGANVVNLTAQNSANMDAYIRNNSISNNHANQAGAVSNLLVASSSIGNVTYDITNNTVTADTSSVIANTSNGIAVVKGLPDSGSGGTMSGVVTGNTIGISNVPGSGSAFTGLFASALGSGTHTTLISNNTIYHFNEEGIFLKANDPLTGGNSVLNATVIGNKTLNPDSLAGGGSFAGLWVQAGSGSGTETNTINLVLGDANNAAAKNDFSTGDPANGSDVFISEDGTNSVINLSKAGSVAATAVGVIQADNINPAGTVVSANGTINLITAASYRVIAAPATVYEDGATNIVYTFLRYGDTTSSATINFSVGGTATFGTDYTQSGAATFNGSSGSVTFAAGSAFAQITLDPTVDGGIEANETIVLTITTAGAIAPTGATATILDDDTPALMLNPDAGATTTTGQGGEHKEPVSDGTGNPPTGDPPTGDPGTGGGGTGPTGGGTPPPPPVVVDDGIVSQSELDLLVNAAIQRWSDAGLTHDQLAAMRAVSVTVSDMMGLYLGSSNAGQIRIDSDGAGYGWFVDSTPGEDSEYEGAGSRLTADRGGAADHHIDLLTVVMHELGHQIGLEDSYRPADASELMYGYLNPSERRLPAAGDADGAVPGSLTHEEYAIGPIAVAGTLPGNKAVDVIFSSIVNTFTDQIIPTFNNQSTVSDSGGGPSSFPSTLSNVDVLTIDTLTLGNTVFKDTNLNGTFDAGEGVVGVALQLYADTNDSGGWDAGDVLLTSTTTGAGGAYSFTGLSQGDFIVVVTAANFNVGGPLANLLIVPGAAADPDNNVDNDNNGVAATGGAVASQTITLAYNTEPTAGTGNDTNNTLDFGFVVNQPPVAGDDSVSVAEDSGANDLTSQLLSNDTDPDNDTRTIASATQGAHGSTSVVAGVLTYTPTGNYNGTDTFDYTINDGKGHTDTATVSVTVTAVNDPVTGSAPPTASLNEDATNVAITGMSIADVDATLAPAGVYEVVLQATHGTLTLTTLTGLTFTGGSDGTGDTVMTFHGTLAAINTALATAKYTPDANYNGSAQIDMDVTDQFGVTVATGSGAATADFDSIAVTINPVNDEPVGSDASDSTAESLNLVFDLNNFVPGFSDPLDGDSFAGIVVTSVPTVAQGLLKLNGTTLVGGESVTATQINNGNLIFVPAAGTAGTSPTFHFQVRDDGGVANSGVDLDQSFNIFTINITVADVAPVVDLNGPDGAGNDFAASYTEGAAPAAVADADVTITDADAGDKVESATISISNPFTGDQLNIVGALPGSIVATGAGTDTITLSGTGTQAEYQTALTQIVYSSTSDNPTNSGASLTRDIGITVSDGDLTSVARTTIITVTDINDAPTGTSSTINAVEDSFRVLSAADLGFNDVDGTLASVTISAVTGGKIYFDADGAGAGAPVEATLSHTYSAAELAAGEVSFKADPNANGSGLGTITFTVTDDDGADAASSNTLTVDVTAVNDSPDIDGVGVPVNATEQTAVAILAGKGVSDVDLDARNGGNGDYAGSSFSIARNLAANPEDQFTLVAGPNFTIDGSDLKSGGQIFGTITTNAGGQLVIAFTSLGTAATSSLVDEVIAAVNYTNSSDSPPSSVSLAYSFNDGAPGGGQGAGASSTDDQIVSVLIEAINDAPVNALGGTIGTGEDAVNAWLSGMSVSDPDADPANDEIYVTFQVEHGTLAIDDSVVGGITSADIVAQSADTITVQATLDEINATLSAANGLTYSPNLNFNGDDTLTVTTNDAGHNGTDPALTGDGTSEEDVDTRTISVSANDDPPVAQPDAVSTPENVVVTGDLFANNGSGPDSDVEGDPFTISAVSDGGTVGTPFMLPSGAILTVNADGTYSYNPNGKFNYLTHTGNPGEETGAVNTTATDSFQYTVSGGNTVTVTVTVNGVAGPGDELRGDGTDNVITGTPNADFFRVDQGGNDSLSGLAGNDVFLFGKTLTSADSVDGGPGADQIAIQGDYSGGVTLGAGVVSVESLALLPGNDTRFGDVAGNLYDYSITTVDANVAAGAQMVVDGNRLQVGEDLTFNGSAETDGSFFIYGGHGVDTLTGGAKNDVFYFADSGQWGASDVVDGGPAGTDQLALRGDYTISFGAGQLLSIESIGLVSAFDTRYGLLGAEYDYDLTMNDGNVAAGVQMTVDGAALRGTETLMFNGSAETNGTFRVFGGAADDNITGGSGNDLLSGGLGADTLTGGAGNDVFVYRSAAESTSVGRDGIQDFTLGDKINLQAIDAITGTAADDAFTFIGSSAFHNVAGELRATNSGPIWTVQGDTNGDGISDFEVVVVLTAGHPLPLDGTDFIL